MSARDFHDAFATPLLEADRPAPDGLRVPANDSAARRFNVYRNNVLVSLVDALAARFPVTERLVGTDFFRVMAQAFSVESPPRSPLLMTYGDGFADFIDRFPPAASLPYLADVARLEAARTRAYHAADAEPLSPAALAGQDGATLATCRLVLHPSVQVQRSRHAIATIWFAHQEAEIPPGLDPDEPEDVLVTRPDADVFVMRLPAGGGAFVTALADGAGLADAAADAAGVPGFDLTENLAALFAARAVVAIDQQEGETHDDA